MTAAPGGGPRPALGILGGTGLYDIEGIAGVREVALATPFGEPSGPFVTGDLEGTPVVFLSRHGRGHRLLPGEVNYRANVYGFRKLGVRRVLSVNSVGSLKEEIRPRDIVFADQFVDRTRRRSSFFGDGAVAHISFAHPVCGELSDALHAIAVRRGLRAHRGGTYVCIEGPAFSTRAESRLYKSWGCDVIGMTGATEAKLFREAGICYATMSLSTDYDAWHEEEAPVTVEMILENLNRNIDNAKAVIKTAAGEIPALPGQCDCRHALRNAVVTRRDLIPPATREALSFLLDEEAA